MAHYLVTGGAGFIGSHVTEQLLRLGHKVRIIDNFVTGTREKVIHGAEVIEANIEDFDSIASSFTGVDGVFHLAARPSVPFSVEHPIESAKTNMMGTLNVLVAARDAHVKRLVYSASSSAYGKNIPPHRIEMIPDPLSPYAMQKYVGEVHARMFAELYDMETVSLRYFNVYGPRMNEVGAYVPVFSFFLRQKRAGVALTIFGDGEQKRDFTHVTDVARANIAAMVSPRVGHGEVLNVGAGGGTSVNRIAELFGGPVIHVQPRPGDIKDSQADISRTMELLDWKPTIAFEEGLGEWLRMEGVTPVLRSLSA